MTRKMLLIPLAAGSLIVAAAALAFSAHPPAPMPKVDASYGFHSSRHVNRHILDGCFSEPVECGLVVW